MKLPLFRLLLAWFMAHAACRVGAQSVPNTMNYQGVIANAAGVPLATGSYDLKFRVYNAGQGGALIWGPQSMSASVVDGQFNVVLGPVDESARPLSGAFATATVYLEIQVGANNPISPRQQILTAPFAFQSDMAAKAATLVNTAGAPLVTSSGNNVTFTGSVTATSFSGVGSGLTGLTASQIPNLDASKIASGTLDPTRIPNLNASKITTGTLSATLIPTTLSGNRTYSGDVFVTERLGVGKSPAEKLDVAGNARVSGNLTAASFNGNGAGLNALNGVNLDDGSVELKKLVNEIQEALCPPGTILPYAGDNPPSGWLLCDGKSGYPPAGFPKLFAVIGYRFGGFTQNGVHFFLPPDLRGRFLRGRDAGAGRDPDVNARVAMYGEAATKDAVGSLQTDQFRSHVHVFTRAQSPSTVNYSSSGGQSAFHNGNLNDKDITQTTGGTETRPVNVYVNYIIKY